MLTNIGLIVSGADYASLVIPAIFAILFFLQAFYLRTSRQMRLLDLEAKTPLYTILADTISGLEHIRSFGWDTRVLDETSQLLDHSQKSFYYMISIQRWLLLVLDLLGVVIATVLITTSLIYTSTTSQSGLGLSLLSLAQFSALSKALIEKWTTLETSLGSVMRLQEFAINTPVEKDDDDVQPMLDKWPSKGRVEFKSVTSKYRYDALVTFPYYRLRYMTNVFVQLIAQSLKRL